MLNSTKVTDSPRHHRMNSNTTLNDTANGMPRSFVQPKITSTPLHTASPQRRESVFATPPKPHLLSPRRYSLSEIATPPRYLNRRDSNMSTIIHNSAGPLLGSTPYNMNVSTYMDAKSPGLAGRAVQYNEERERPRPTHQEKYGSPGLFPIVHLFKKELPSFNVRPKRVTVRIASPDFSRQNSQEHNRQLMEGLIRPTANRHGLSSLQINDSSTRSVLDALKEISRKRIHSSEEFDLNEEPGKRLRTECFNSKESNKRYRADSPVLENSTSPISQLSKKICVYDEYAASCSSTDYALKKANQGSKRKSISSLIENPKDSKQVKLISVETQTSVAEQPDEAKKTKETITSEGVADSNTEKDTAVDGDESTSPVKVFDDTPLERIRKNRLAALMGTLASKDAVLAPKPSKELEPTDTTKSSTVETKVQPIEKPQEKPLISILSTPKKSSPKSDKHVTFKLPESSSSLTSQLSETSSINLTLSSSTNKAPTLVSESTVSVSIPTTITSTSTAVPSFSFGTNANSSTVVNQGEKLVTPTPPTSPVMFEKSMDKIVGSNISKESSSINTFMPSKEPSIPSSLSTASTKSSLAELFGPYKPAPTTTLAASVFPIGSSASLTGTGPSSFSFRGTGTAATAHEAPKMSFGSTNIPADAIINSSSMKTPTMGTSVSPKMGGFKFDLPKSTTITATTTTIAPHMFSSSRKSESIASKQMFGSSTVTSAVAAVTPTFGQGLPAGGFSFVPKTTLAAPQTISVDPPAATKPSINFLTTSSFGSSSATPTTTTPGSSVGFGAVNMSFKLGGNGTAVTTVSESKPMFSLPTNSTPAFGGGIKPASNLSSTVGFNSATTASLSFGTTVSSSSHPTFGVPNTQITSSTAPTFGVPNTQITSSTAPTFGVPNTQITSSTAPSFGGSTSFSAKPAVFAFGAKPTAVTTTVNQTPGFGEAVSTTSMFASNNKPTFGASANTTQSFQNKTPQFVGATNAIFSNPSPSFGQNPNQSTFGGPKTTASASFGVATSTMSFGTPTTTAVSFGAGANTATPAFGAPNATSANMFGSNTSTSPAFGAKTPGFGSTSSNIFANAASPPTSSTFAGNSKPLFGSTATTTAAFGGVNTTTTAPTFGGNSTPAFGGTNNSFGAKTVNNSFGGTSSGFGTTTTASNMFGTTTTPAFGTSNSFGGTATSGFATTNTFGSGTSSFGGSSSSGGSFGSNPRPAFGGASNGGNANNAAASFGSGGFGNANAGGSGSFGTGFGANASTSAFAKPQNSFESTSSGTFGTNSSFGSSTPQNSTAFSATNPPTTQGGVFSFGSGSAPKPAGVFAFGSDEVPKPSFNFTGGSAAPPAFGGAAPPAFGSGGPPAFGAGGAPQFNATPTPGTFSIGAGSPSGTRTRTQLRAKRRT